MQNPSTTPRHPLSSCFKRPNNIRRHAGNTKNAWRHDISFLKLEFRAKKNSGLVPCATQVECNIHTDIIMKYEFIKDFVGLEPQPNWGVDSWQRGDSFTCSHVLQTTSFHLSLWTLFPYEWMNES
jgi:hypothetical protein